MGDFQWLADIVKPLLGVVVGGAISLTATFFTLKHNLSISREERRHVELREWRLFQLEQMRIVQSRMWEVAILASDFEDTARTGLKAALERNGDLYHDTMRSLDPLRTRIVTLMHEMEVAAALLEDEVLRTEIEALLATATLMSQSALNKDTFGPVFEDFQSKYEAFRKSVSKRARSLMVEEST